MNDKPLIEFPCSYDIKVIGDNSPQLLEVIIKIVTQMSSNFNESTNIKEKESKTGKYKSYDVTINAESKEQLDRIYQALNKEALVRITL